MDFEKCKNWYDGYNLGSCESVYNPRSVVLAMENQEYLDYWTSTGPLESISDYITQNVDGLHDEITLMIENKDEEKHRVPVNIRTFMNRIDNINTKDDIYTYLIHIGYLTYDKDKKECYIPNEEIREEWGNALVKVPDMKPFHDLFISS